MDLLLLWPFFTGDGVKLDVFIWKLIGWPPASSCSIDGSSSLTSISVVILGFPVFFDFGLWYDIVCFYTTFSNWRPCLNTDSFSASLSFSSSISEISLACFLWFAFIYFMSTTFSASSETFAFGNGLFVFVREILFLLTKDIWLWRSLILCPSCSNSYFSSISDISRACSLCFAFICLICSFLDESMADISITGTAGSLAAGDLVCTRTGVLASFSEEWSLVYALASASKTSVFWIWSKMAYYSLNLIYCSCLADFAGVTYFSSLTTKVPYPFFSTTLTDCWSTFCILTSRSFSSASAIISSILCLSSRAD